MQEEMAGLRASKENYEEATEMLGILQDNGLIKKNVKGELTTVDSFHEHQSILR